MPPHAADALDELGELLAALKAPDWQLDDRSCAQRLLDYGPPGSAAAEAAGKCFRAFSISFSVTLT